jgi:hypothetical protein
MIKAAMLVAKARLRIIFFSACGTPYAPARYLAAVARLRKA